MDRIRELVPELPRQAWAVLGGHTVSAVGSGLTLPFLLVYLNSVRGITLATAGLAVSTVALGSLFGNFGGGWLVDRIGARSAVIVGLVLSAGGTASLALVDSTPAAFAATGLVGIGTGVTWPAEDALLATVVRARQRSAVFSVRFAATNAGLGIGALLAAGVVDIAVPWTFTAIYLGNAVAFLLYVPVLVVLVPHAGRAATLGSSPGQARGGYRRVVRDRLFLGVWAVTALVVTVSYGQYHSSFPAFATGEGGLSARGLSLAFAANTLTIVVAQLVVLRVMTGRRRTRGIMLACALWIITWTVTIVAGQVAGGLAVVLFAVAMVFFALGETLFSPTVPAIVNDLASDELRGRYNGMFMLAWTTGFMLGPAIAGFGLGAGLGSAFFGILIAACVLTAAAARLLERRLPKEANVITDAWADLEEPDVPPEPMGQGLRVAPVPPEVEPM
ncbi:MAG: MFS transporter [Solirubrobacterales bacterium]